MTNKKNSHIALLVIVLVSISLFSFSVESSSNDSRLLESSTIVNKVKDSKDSKDSSNRTVEAATSRDSKNSTPTIYFVVTSTITHAKNSERDTQTRQEQYKRGISHLLNATQAAFSVPHRVIIAENSVHAGPTFLDDFVKSHPKEVSVLYTHNNKKPTNNYGEKELLDVLQCIDHFGMQDDDLLVKMTGRYYLNQASQFISVLRRSDLTKTKAIVKYGSFFTPINVPMEDCLTGLIMLPVAAVRGILKDPKHKAKDSIEWAWARASLALPPSQVHAVQGKLGISIAPMGRRAYYEV